MQSTALIVQQDLIRCRKIFTFDTASSLAAQPYLSSLSSLSQLSFADGLLLFGYEALTWLLAVADIPPRRGQKSMKAFWKPPRSNWLDYVP